VQALCTKSLLMLNGRLSAFGSPADIVPLYLASNTGEFVGGGDFRDLDRRGEGNVRFRRIEFLDRNRLTFTSPKTGEELNIVLESGGSRTSRRPARVGITQTQLFLCAMENSLREPLHIGAGDRTNCRIP
jgi:hypothetical protein